MVIFIMLTRAAFGCVEKGKAMTKDEPDVGAILVGKLNRFSERRKVSGLKNA